MTILYVILLIIAIILLLIKDKDSFYKNLFKVITLKITDYYCKGSKTKAVMTYMRIVGVLYEGSVIGYPIIKAGVKCNQENGFWSLFIEYQWDSVSSVMTYFFVGNVTVVVIAYLILYRFDDNATKTLDEIKEGNDNIQSGVDRVYTSIESVDTKVDAILSNSRDLGITEHLIYDLRESISKLKVDSAFKYLQTIWKELEINKKGDFELRASIQYLMGECARFVKNLDSKDNHENAYNLMKKGGWQDGCIIEGMVYEACRRKEYNTAQQYVEELIQIDYSSPWCLVPTLMAADDLQQTFDSIPESNSKMTSLGLCIMMGGGKNHDLGVELAEYSYNNLLSISTSNFPLWILDLSVATTLFCQNLVVHKDIKLMSNEHAKKVFTLTDRFLSLLQNTEIENILPDTVFLHAVTGYFENQDKKWLDILKNSKPSASLEEIFYLTYSVILNNASDYESAQNFLAQYKGNSIASILNMRCMLAVYNNDFQECIEAMKYSSQHHVIVPDHLANYYFSTVYSFYDSIKDYANNIEFESDTTKRAYSIFLDFVSGKEIDSEYIETNKQSFHFAVAPYMAIVAKEKISLALAIDLLENCVERKVLDLRSSLLIDYYSKDPNSSLKLYHLLKDLRKAGAVDIKNLSIELNMSNRIGDNDNCLEITYILTKLLPDDDIALVNHLQALFRCGGHEQEIRSFKDRFINKIFSPQMTRIVFDIFHIIGDTYFAVDFLYNQIESTKNQELKDYYLAIHMNSEVKKVIFKEKETIGIGDSVTLCIQGETKDYDITSGSTYEALVGCKKGETKTIKTREDVEVTICDIHTKYSRLVREIFREIGDTNSSKSIKMFNLDDYNFKNDPLGALQKIAGRTEESLAKEQTLLQQYRKGEMSLLCFINEHKFFSDMYEKIFGDFSVCIMPNEFFSRILSQNKKWKNMELVLDISSVVVLHEYDLKFGLPDDITYNVPNVILSVLKEQIINEEKGMPSFFSQKILGKTRVNNIDDNKTPLWNKLKSIEQWLSKRCKIQTVEETINLDLSHNNNQCFRIEVESLILAKKGMLLLSEDWCYTKRYFNDFATMSCFNWMSLMGINNADKWGQTMLECGNLGYPMTHKYIRSQYDLAANAHPNNYHTCIDNIEFNLLSWEEVVSAAKSLLTDVVEPTKVAGATNLMSILFKNMDDQMCRLIVQKELLSSRDQLWHQCMADALRISHPLILPQ